jgi:dTDP-4-amino-4,6-dideoxygalactose transaminase
MSIKDEIDAVVSDVISTAGFIGGPRVSAFEEAFSAFQQAAHAVGVGNGTDAIEIAIEALDLSLGSEVIVPANSFIASSEAVTRSGHRVVFADIDPSTQMMTLQTLEAARSDRTAAVVAVHLYGRPVDLTKLRSFADQHGLAIIEDAAQAHGAEHAGQRVGAIGDIGTFSFYPGKNLGAYGDGGAIVTNDGALAERCRMIANHGRVGKYVHEFEGRNSRLDALQAAVLEVKLGHLDSWIDQRNTVADTYRRILADVDGLRLPAPVADGDRHAYHLFVVSTSRRQELQIALKTEGIQTAQHYPVALTRQPAYTYLDQDFSDFHANTQDEQLLSLPIGEHLSEEDAEFVADAVKRFFA